MSDNKRVTQFYISWKEAQQRLDMAMQTLQGAQAQVSERRYKFEGAVELLGGTGASWRYDEKDGIIITEAPPTAVNEPTPKPGVLTGNHESRRVKAKALGLMPEYKTRRKAAKP